ncbi:hypothetical protein H6G89_27215 [Oscillatoria sp. FACHB-1407]|uniref:hypothetical protein n=1 Tax=Oscillatoria sp. FACHB-1407 TaxID=2692847 RepID=UPI0016870A1C|nr:hypothetical protein [Oscillatoria sp. FACHB-1407]MBD2464699.1 hypothetical protein [Oscillatoria sp. FACHB-1407]
MTKHYVLNINPSAEYDWDRCTLRDPITAERPELAQLVADAVDGRSGAYLVSVEIQIKVLEEAPLPQTKPVPLSKAEVPAHTSREKQREMVA